jgi:hypothetical protein
MSMAAIAMNARRRVRHCLASVAKEKVEEPELRSMWMDTVRNLARFITFASIRFARQSAPIALSKVGQFKRCEVVR